MADLTIDGQAPPLTLPHLDLEERFAQLEAKLTQKQEILPNAVYGREEAIAVTGFSLSTFIRAEQKQKLKGRWEGRRRFYLGVDLLNWLQGKETDDGTN